MASAVPVKKKLKKKNIPRIEAATYAETALNDLVTASIHFLLEHGVTTTTEEVVSTCFRLFPHKFSLKHYTRWPDSALVIRRLTDCREKGLVRGNPQEGFTLKFKGQKLAERTALALGLVKPAPVQKKRKPAPAKKKPPVKAAQPAVKEKKRAVRNKTAVIAKKSLPAAKVKKEAVIPKAKPVKKKAVQQKPLPPKVVETSQPRAKVKPQKEQVVQIATALPPKEAKPAPQPVKEKKKKTIPQLTKLQAIKPEAAIPARPVPAVSKEEKVRAEKIVRAMERSDAFRHFGKNGRGSRISEFDFRNMLLATMESSPETLVRNIELFKRSAGIHARQDLVTFLDYCEANFAELLKPSPKKSKKR
jgi:hypothetical protein